MCVHPLDVEGVRLLPLVVQMLLVGGEKRRHGEMRLARSQNEVAALHMDGSSDCAELSANTNSVFSEFAQQKIALKRSDM